MKTHLCNILRILMAVKLQFSIDCFFILNFAQNIDSMRRFHRYLQFMFQSKHKNKCIPCTPQFYYIKVGYNGSTLHRCFTMMVSTSVDGTFHNDSLRSLMRSKEVKHKATHYVIKDPNDH